MRRAGWRPTCQIRRLGANLHGIVGPEGRKGCRLSLGAYLLGLSGPVKAPASLVQEVPPVMPP